MKRLLTVVMAVLLALLTTGASAGLDDTREERELQQLTHRYPRDRDASFPVAGEAGRVLGPDGKRIRVYVQFRRCGKSIGPWRMESRETTTARGRFDFDTSSPRTRRTYHYRQYRVRHYPTWTQSAFFIPGTATYRPFRLVSNHCYSFG